MLNKRFFLLVAAVFFSVFLAPIKKKKPYNRLMICWLPYGLKTNPAVLFFFWKATVWYCRKDTVWLPWILIRKQLRRLFLHCFCFQTICGYGHTASDWRRCFVTGRPGFQVFSPFQSRFFQKHNLAPSAYPYVRHTGCQTADRQTLCILFYRCSLLLLSGYA